MKPTHHQPADPAAVKSLVVFGGGESGVGAALLAQARGYDVFLSDRGTLKPPHRAALERAGIAFEEGGHTESRVLAADEIVKSPGIPPSVPLLLEAYKRGIPITSEIELGARHTAARLIAITGTNGKTTTTLLTHHLLESAGIRARLAGNVGQSLAGQVLHEAEEPVDFYVVELSSFQLEDTAEPLRPFAAALLNITPDHLDRYQYEFHRYAAAKLRITDGMLSDNALVFNLDDRGIREHFPEVFFQGMKLPFSLRRPSLTHHPCAWVDPEERRAHFTLPGSGQPHRSVSLRETVLLGQHNQQNILAALLLAGLAGATDAQMEAGLATFRNADHRLQPVGEVDGVLYLTDSKATNVEAAWFALDGIPAERPIVWIAGGTDKGNNYESLLPLARKKVRALVCLGVENVKLCEAFTECVDTLVETRSMLDAVAEARRLAQPGDVVLLSPCCASFDLFQNYEDRGRQFAAAVAAMDEGKAESAS